ncbi:MAG: ATP-dependent dethiobiotin synthetase BioD [Actinomycetota bacterium]
MLRKIAVTGTATEIGKTWVTANVIESLRAQGRDAAARKPVQSFSEGEGPTDAEVLAAASGESVDVVCPRHRWYELPLAPPMAAEALHRPPIACADLVRELRLPDDGFVFIEGVGGPRSPLADDGDTIDLAEDIDADLVLLVAAPELGTINATVLAAEAFGKRPLVVFLNRYDDSSTDHVRNRDWLENTSGLTVVTNLQDLVSKLLDTTEAG